MSRKKMPKLDISELQELAECVGIDDNPLFKSALSQYIFQMNALDTIRRQIDEDNLTVSRTYIKGETNTYCNPLIREIPRLADSATKTAAFLWGMIRDSLKRESEKESVDPFDEFLAEKDMM